MSTQTLQDQPAAAVSPASGKWAMLALIVVIPVVAFLGSLLFIKYGLRQNTVHSGWEAWLMHNSLGYETRNTQCDVLIYGDSTAMTGLNPHLIQDSTGLKTCNISISLGSIVVVGQDPLEEFLAHNPRPRYLVMQFGSAALRKSMKWNDTKYLEGVELLVKYYPLPRILKDIAAHPDSIIAIYRLAARQSFEVLQQKLRGHPAAAAADEEAQDPINSFLTLPFPGYQRCDAAAFDPKGSVMPDPARIAQLREQFGGKADHLMLMVAPTSNCDADYARKTAVLKTVGVSYEEYPITMFNDGWVHYTSAGSEKLSLEVAGQIKAQENSVSH